MCRFDREWFNLRSGGALIQLENADQYFREKPFSFSASMVSLGGPALGHVMCIEENPSATSRLQWIAFGFAGNNRVNTLVPDLRIAVVTESNVGICSVPKLPSRAKSLTRLKCRRRRNSTRRRSIL